MQMTFGSGSVGDLIESVVNNKNALMHWARIGGEFPSAAGKRTEIGLRSAKLTGIHFKYFQNKTKNVYRNK